MRGMVVLVGPRAVCVKPNGAYMFFVGVDREGGVDNRFTI